MENEPYIYAKRPRPFQGTIDLCCVVVEFKDTKKGPSVASCKTMGNQIAEFYNRNSRGLLKIRVKAYKKKVAANGSRKGLRQAEQAILKQYKNADLFAVVSTHTHPHAGGKIAHLPGTLVSTARHEFGHLIDFAHSGQYEENEKFELDNTGDRESVMSRYPSNNLTAPQYFNKGWMPEEEAVMYQPGRIYKLKRITAFEQEGVAVVIVPNKYFRTSAVNDEDAAMEDDEDDEIVDFEELDGTTIENDAEEAEVSAILKQKPKGQKGPTKVRDLYLSFPPGIDAGVVLHLSSGGASQKIKTVTNEFTDHRLTGAHVKILGKEDNQVIFSIDFADLTS